MHGQIKKLRPPEVGGTVRVPAVNTQYHFVEKGHGDHRNGLAVVMELNIKCIINNSLLLS